MNPVCFVFEAGSTIFIFLPFTVTQDTRVLYDYILDSMARVQSVDDTSVFVGDANVHHSEWLESVYPTDRHGRDALDFCNLSGYEQLVRCATHIAGNRLDLVMTDGTPLETSDNCFVRFLLRVEQSLLEYNIRNTVFLKHRTNWDNVLCAVRSFTWSTKSADPLEAFDRAIGEVIGIGLLLPLFCVEYLETSNGSMQAAGELMMLSRLHIMPGVEHAVQIIGVNLCLLVLRSRGSMVLGGSHIMNAPGILEHSTCSHKWLEPNPTFSQQKQVPTILVGIPVIYILALPTARQCFTLGLPIPRKKRTNGSYLPPRPGLPRGLSRPWQGLALPMGLPIPGKAYQSMALPTLMRGLQV